MRWIETPLSNFPIPDGCSYAERPTAQAGITEIRVLFAGQVVRTWGPPPTADEWPAYDPATQRCDWRADDARWEVWAPGDYAALRAAAYPPLAELADAHVKLASGDPATHDAGADQIKAYIAACLAVKARYPKPSEATP